jgi:predicted metal-dependent hydrolase
MSIGSLSMPPLTVRKLTFDFTGDVPFQWQPDNPRLATSVNAASFFAVGFERYVVKAMRDAMPLIKDPDVFQEAKSFLGQEAQHGIAHKLHVDSMIRLYPNLKYTYEKVCQLFDKLYENKSMKFRLAYVANMESAFQPVIHFTIGNRETLFSKGDKRISSLFLWHAIEEAEHRGSASMIYDHLVKSRWYRLAKIPRAISHQMQFDALVRKEFELHIPRNDRMAGLDSPPKPYGSIPYKQRFLLALHLARSIFPWHNPENKKLPEWFDEWRRADRDGVDMTTFYGR